jgi:hypothetical protein
MTSQKSWFSIMKNANTRNICEAMSAIDLRQQPLKPLTVEMTMGAGNRFPNPSKNNGAGVFSRPIETHHS